MAEKTSILTPPGRFIWGDAYEGETKNMQGAPLVVKTGPNAGQPRSQWAIGLAIPKTKAAWWDESYTKSDGTVVAWGAAILAEGQKSFPNGAWQRPDFAWKVIDGDDTRFNQGTPPKRFCDIPNYKGNWVLKFASGFAPKIVNENGTAEIIQPGYVYPGCFIQVFGSIEGNRNDQKPGLYMNLQIISFQAHGERITTGPDAGTVGFGGGALPAGASTTPPGGMGLAQAQQTAQGMPGLPGMPGGTTQMPAQGLPTPAAPLAVQPNPAFVTLPGAQVVPGAMQGAAVGGGIPALPGAAVPGVPALPVVPQRQLTAKAQGATYEQLIAGGWTEDLMRTHGLLV
jgi:hypothetical protein